MADARVNDLDQELFSELTKPLAQRLLIHVVPPFADGKDPNYCLQINFFNGNGGRWKATWRNYCYLNQRSGLSATMQWACSFPLHQIFKRVVEFLRLCSVLFFLTLRRRWVRVIEARDWSDPAERSIRKGGGGDNQLGYGINNSWCMRFIRASNDYLNFRPSTHK